MRRDFILIYNTNYPNIPAFFTLLLNKGSVHPSIKNNLFPWI